MRNQINTITDISIFTDKMHSLEYSVNSALQPFNLLYSIHTTFIGNSYIIFTASIMKTAAVRESLTFNLFEVFFLCIHLITVATLWLFKRKISLFNLHDVYIILKP